MRRQNLIESLRKIGPDSTVVDMLDLSFHCTIQDLEMDNYLCLAGNQEDFLIIPSGLDKTANQACQEKIVVVYSSLATIEQFVAGYEWPDTIGNDHCPAILVAEFKSDDTARVRLRNWEEHGIIIWTKKEINFEGSWKATLKHLIKLQKLALKRI